MCSCYYDTGAYLHSIVASETLDLEAGSIPLIVVYCSIPCCVADGVDFRLTTVAGPLRVTEGDTLELVLTRQFETMLPILVTVQGNAVSPSQGSGPVAGRVNYCAPCMALLYRGWPAYYRWCYMEAHYCGCNIEGGLLIIEGAIWRLITVAVI